VLPTVHKRCVAAVFAAFAGLLAAGPAQAAPAPKLKSADTVDSDRDGHVDGVSLRWSQTVRGGYDAKAPFAISVRGYRVTKVGAALGKAQHLDVAERRQCDTGGSVRVAFRSGRRGTAPMKSMRGKRKVRSHKLDMRRFDLPVPRITCAVTLDADRDARIDGVRVTYSREVRSRKQTRGRFLFSVAGYKVKAVKAARGRFLQIKVAERATPDSDAKPVVGYSRPKRKTARKFAVRGGRRGKAFGGTYRSTRDGVSPQLIAGETGDADHDGLLDAITLRFSEPVRAASTAGVNVLGLQVKPAAAVNGADLSLSLVEGTARGDARPGAWIDGPGVTDVAGNAALHGAVQPADAAAPVMLAAATQDTGGKKGYVDTIAVTFSEPVSHPRDAGGSYPFLLSGRTVTTVEPANGTSVQVRIAEAGSPDTGARPTVRYLAGPGFPVVDGAGNNVADTTVSSADAVAPALMSATTADDDDDGRIDRMVLTFSEDVEHGAELGQQSSFSVSGYDVTGAGAASGRDVSLGLEEGAGPDSGATPAVTYNRDGLEDVRDAAANLTPNSSVSDASDGARPVLLSVETGDVDDDGRIDRLASTWSESLVHADDTSAPFAVSASGFSVARVRAAAGDDLAIDLTEPAGSDTGSKPNVTYLGDDDAKIRDAAGLEPEERTWAGLTVDALNPRLVSATTGDTDSDGELDSIAVRFSESVVHAQEASPGSFTAGAFTILSAEAAAGDAVELKLQQSGIGDTGVRPAVGYTPDALNDVRDPAGNFAPTGSIAQATDGARPVLLTGDTADVNDNGKLDRVTTNWSEPLVHADDSSTPFPVTFAQFNVSRVHAASGQALAVDLAEPATPDTGSAPDLTYTGGADPIRDVAGLEPAQTAFPGRTRDALPPRRVSTITVDADQDGKLDAIDIEWSERVTGATGTAPYTVTGRTLGGNVSFSQSTTRVPFVEDPAQFDTDATPNVSYDAGPGDLHDEAEGLGDTTMDAPSVATETPLDKAAPILVAAKTADLTTPSLGNVPNGTIDAVLATFSESVEHPPDAFSPFSLNVTGRSEIDVEGDTGPGDKTLYVRVTEAASPDGGLTPSVAVQPVGPVADRIKDRAATPNEALGMTFTGTADEVSPVLMSAQLGERPGGACTKTAVSGIDGEVDCVLTTWSEDVEHAADASAPFSVSSSGWAIEAGGIGQLGPSTTLEIPLTSGAVKDRDRSGTTVGYDGAADTPVVDTAAVANEALNGTKVAEPACKDTGLEPNDARDGANPQLNTTAPSFQRKCAFDDDWYRLQTDPTGFLELVTRPSTDVDIDFDLYDSTGALISPTQVIESGGTGQIDQREYSGLAADTVYWVRVTANESPAPQEGPYCVVFSDDAAVEAGCGPLVGQVVFTEVGFGNDKFVEIKNDFDVPVDMEGAGAKLVLGEERRECTLTMPTGPGQSTIDPGEHLIVQETASATAFGCSLIPTLASGGERVELSANGAIDVVDFAGVIDSPVAAQHSLQFVEDDLVEDADANNDVVKKWCRSWAAHSKGDVGDGCDEYRINEVLWRPALTSDASDGRYFVELFGNIPAKPSSELLGGWVVRGVNGLTGEGTADFVLTADASPRSNGTYVIADGVSGATQVSTYDRIWDSLDLNLPTWPDGGAAGPRGLQLLGPNPPNNPPCTNSADAFGWTTTAQGFSNPLDNLRSCPGIEGQEYTNSTVGAGAARDNLSNAGDATYNENADSANNQLDFCPQATPNPAQLNIRPGC
jgi:hypothetical protein